MSRVINDGTVATYQLGAFIAVQFALPSVFTAPHRGCFLDGNVPSRKLFKPDYHMSFKLFSPATMNFKRAEIALKLATVSTERYRPFPIVTHLALKLDTARTICAFCFPHERVHIKHLVHKMGGWEALRIAALDSVCFLAFRTLNIVGILALCENDFSKDQLRDAVSAVVV